MTTENKTNNMPADKQAALDALNNLHNKDGYFHASYENIVRWVDVWANTIRAALTAPERSPEPHQPVADLEGLKREVRESVLSKLESEIALSSSQKDEVSLGVNRSINTLHATGRLTTSKDVQELKDAVRDLDSEVSRRQREIENNLRAAIPDIKATGSPAQRKHAATIARIKETE